MNMLFSVLSRTQSILNLLVWRFRSIYSTILLVNSCRFGCFILISGCQWWILEKIMSDLKYGQN